MNNKNSISRRDFLKNSVAGATLLASMSAVKLSAEESKVKHPSLRMGGPVFEKIDGPDAWVEAHKHLGYRAAYCPLSAEVKDDVVNSYAAAAKKADIIIAEVGAWSNPLDGDKEKRNKAIKQCRTQLALAERIGANCCVNISGSRNPTNWAGPDPKNLTKETFDMIVETTRSIIDEVKPTRTCYTLETMPWAYPDSPDSYLQLIKAINRKEFAVHFDPVNLMCSPQRYFKSGDIIREFFKKLGPHIKSCHAKDVILHPEFLTTRLDEIRPGLGGLDYVAFLSELSKFPAVPLMLEHLQKAEEYNDAASHIRSVAKGIGLSFD